MSLLQVLWGGGVFAGGYLQERRRVRGFLHLHSSGHGAQVDISLHPEEVAGAEVLVGGKGDQAQCWSRELERGECGSLGAWCPLEGLRPCGRFTPEASSLELSCPHPSPGSEEFSPEQ